MVPNSESDSTDGYWEIDGKLSNGTNNNLVTPSLPSNYIFVNSDQMVTDTL
jgi:hypothetical protein